MNLHKKSKENHIYSQNQTDEPYNKVHLFFLRCKQDKWNNINYFDMSDAFALILSANSTLPEHLRMHLENMHELCAGLDRLEYRYYSSLSVLFPKSSVIEFKKNILLSLCSPNKKKFFIEKKMDAKMKMPMFSCMYLCMCMSLCICVLVSVCLCVCVILNTRSTEI